MLAVMIKRKWKRMKNKNGKPNHLVFQTLQSRFQPRNLDCFLLCLFVSCKDVEAIKSNFRLNSFSFFKWYNKSSKSKKNIHIPKTILLRLYRFLSLGMLWVWQKEGLAKIMGGLNGFPWNTRTSWCEFRGLSLETFCAVWGCKNMEVFWWSHSRACYVKLAVGKIWSLQVHSNYFHGLPLRLVDSHSKWKSNGKL